MIANFFIPLPSCITIQSFNKVTIIGKIEEKKCFKKLFLEIREKKPSGDFFHELRKTYKAVLHFSYTFRLIAISNQRYMRMIGLKKFAIIKNCR